MTKLGSDEIYLITFACHLGKADLKSGNDVTPGHVSSFGVPKILHTRNDVSKYKHTLCSFVYLFVTCLFGSKRMHCLHYIDSNI